MIFNQPYTHVPVRVVLYRTLTIWGAFGHTGASVDMMILRAREDYVQPYQVMEYSVIAQNRDNSLKANNNEVFGVQLDDEGLLKCTNQAMLKV